jgi:succinoglycan biosynthesis transport protein ExoP
MNGNDNGSRQISARDILTVIFRRKIPIAVVAVIVAAAALTAASRTSSVYEATAKVFIRRIGPTPVVTSWTPYYGLEEEMNTEVEIVQSVEVMARAVEILDEEHVYYETAVGDSILRRRPTIAEMSAGLSAEPVEMSNILLVKYTGSMPNFVQAAANAAAEAYVEHRIQVRSTSGIEDYFQEQLAMLEDRLLNLISAEMRLRKESNIYDLDWQNQMVIARKNDMQGELAEKRSERMAEEQKLELAKKRLEDNPDLLVPFPLFGNDKIGGQMLSEYWMLRNERDEKAAVLTDTNPQVKMLDKRIEEMKARFAEEVQRRILEQEFLVENLRAEESGYETIVNDIAREMSQIPDAVVQIEHLEKEINYTYLHYDKLLEKMLDTMASEADDIRLSNAKIISPASAQMTKVGKLQDVYVAFSILLGLVLGIGFGFLLENLDQSVRTSADVEEDLGVTLLGSIPEMGRLPKFTKRLDKTLGRKSE